MGKKRSFVKGSGFFAVILLIMVFMLASCSGENAERVSEITSVKYDKEDAKINISATLDSADVREFRGETVYLIEVPANSSLSDIVTLIPVAQAKAAAEMSFSLPLKDGARTSLYSAFVLAVFDQANGYIALCDAHYLDNPEALAQNTADYPEYPSIKGLSIVSSSDAVSLGVKHTVIRVPIEDFILPDSTGNTITTVFDGNSHYYNADKVSELDYKIKTLSGAGIEVILEFTLDTHPNELPSSLACLASFTGDATQYVDGGHYAISVMSGDSYRHIAAFFEFLAERYTRADGKYGFAASYIIGNGVNSLTHTGIDDERTLSDSVCRYERLLRIAHSALCSKYAKGKVFVSLDNRWNIAEDNTGEESENGVENPALPVSLRSAFGGAEFLTALSAEISKGGAFDYGVALIPLPSDGSCMVWSDLGSKDSSDTEFLTVKNLSVARRHIGDDRDLIIYNYGISADDEVSMAASYAYAYLKAAEADAYAFIYNGHVDRATGNGNTGLFSLGEDGSAAEKREIYDVFKNIDVKGAPEPEAAKLRIGSDWNALWSEMGEKARYALVTDSAGSTVKDEDDKKLKKAEEKMLFDFRDGQSFDFYPSDSASYIEIAEYIGQRVLKSGLFPKYKGENMGVRSAPIAFEELDGALQITTVLSANSGEGNTAVVTLALQQSNGKGSVFHTSSAVVQSSNRQKVYFDVSDAEIDEKFGDVTLYLWVESNVGRSPIYSGEEAEELVLYVENISALVKKSNRSVIWTIIIVVLAVLIVGVLLLLFFISKNKPKNPGRGNYRPSGVSGRRNPNPNGVRPAGRPALPYRSGNGAMPRPRPGAQGQRPVSVNKRPPQGRSSPYKAPPRNGNNFRG